MKKSFIAIVACAAIFAALENIQANEEGNVDYIKNWNYSVATAFDSWYGSLNERYDSTTGWYSVKNHTNAAKDTSSWGIVFNDEDTKMEWKTGNKSSGMELKAYDGTVQSNEGSATALTLQHNNTTITSGSPAPHIINVALDIILTGIYEDNSVYETTVSLMLTLGFIETPNLGTTGHKYTSDDIFFIIQNDGASETFTDHKNNIYTVSVDSLFEELAGNHLLAAEHFINEYFNETRGNADVYQQPEGALYGWSTKEGETTTNAMNVKLTVEYGGTGGDNATPEPGTLIVMSLAGLLGVPAYRRMKKSTK